MTPTPLVLLTGIDADALARAMVALQWDAPRAVAVRHTIDVEQQTLTRVVSDVTGVVEHVPDRPGARLRRVRDPRGHHADARAPGPATVDGARSSRTCRSRPAPSRSAPSSPTTRCSPRRCTSPRCWRSSTGPRLARPPRRRPAGRPRPPHVGRRPPGRRRGARGPRRVRRHRRDGRRRRRDRPTPAAAARAPRPRDDDVRLRPRPPVAGRRSRRRRPGDRTATPRRGSTPRTTHPSGCSRPAPRGPSS